MKRTNSQLSRASNVLVRSGFAPVYLPSRCHSSGNFALDVRFVLDLLDLLRIVAGLARHRVAAMAAGASQPNRVFAVFEFLERFRRAIFVHRLDLPVTRHTAFESRC